MAVQETNRVAPMGAITIHALFSKVEGLLENLAAWNTQRKTVAALNALSDHELEDIGLYRSDIREMAAKFSTQA